MTRKKRTCHWSQSHGGSPGNGDPISWDTGEKAFMEWVGEGRKGVSEQRELCKILAKMGKGDWAGAEEGVS